MEELTIEVFQAQFGSSDYKVLRLFEGVRAVERARVYGSVTGFPRYVVWLQDAMTSAVGVEVERFDKESAGAVSVREGDVYDMWTVSRKLMLRGCHG